LRMGAEDREDDCSDSGYGLVDHMCGG
jgi:hypothetical protein